MALYIPQSILHLARSLYVRPETYGPNYVNEAMDYLKYMIRLLDNVDSVRGSS